MARLRKAILAAAASVASGILYPVIVLTFSSKEFRESLHRLEFGRIAAAPVPLWVASLMGVAAAALLLRPNPNEIAMAHKQNADDLLSALKTRNELHSIAEQDWQDVVNGLLNELASLDQAEATLPDEIAMRRLGRIRRIFAITRDHCVNAYKEYTFKSIELWLSAARHYAGKDEARFEAFLEYAEAGKAGKKRPGGNHIGRMIEDLCRLHCIQNDSFVLTMAGATLPVFLISGFLDDPTVPIQVRFDAWTEWFDRLPTPSELWDSREGPPQPEGEHAGRPSRGQPTPSDADGPPIVPGSAP